MKTSIHPIDEEAVMNMLLALLLAAAVAAPALALEINEIRIDNAGGDTDEYFELIGSPGESLDGLFYVVIGDGTGASGVLESITDLNGMAIAADGLLSVHNSASVGTCGGYDVEAAMQFENGDNVTHMLVQGMTGTAGDDLDTDDDGVFDVTPWTGILDSVGLKEDDEGELLYSDVIVGPDGTFVPAHVLKCEGAWYIGSFDLCLYDTPGESNAPSCSLGSEETSFGELKARYR
jgi:hypothetical protein